MNKVQEVKDSLLAIFKGSYIELYKYANVDTSMLYMVRKGSYNELSDELRADVGRSIDILRNHQTKILLVEHQEFELSHPDMIDWLVKHWYTILSKFELEVEAVIDTAGRWQQIRSMIEDTGNHRVTMPAFNTCGEANTFVKEYISLRKSLQSRL
ncbi:MAG: hypothetical protein ACFCUU_01735 [Cyclobacteriaceae bacterium]